MFVDEEIAALRDMIHDWIGEGFTTPPYKPAIASVIEKLGLSDVVRKMYDKD